MKDAEVLVGVTGSAGRLTLNRPHALNSLTMDMVDVMARVLSSWELEPDVRCVLLEGAGERGLCAGGDIRAIYDSAKVGGGAARHFWRHEYRLNVQISRYPKPYIAIMDGVVMGGGVGVSAHGGIRIVTERTTVAMPEVGIGFVPDVGGTYLLSRAPGELGTHAALTAARLSAADAILCGLADYYVPSMVLPRLVDDVVDAPSARIEEIVRAYAERPPAAELAGHRGWIDDCYQAGTVEQILGRLRQSDCEVARKAAEDISTKSPTAEKVTLRALRNARELTTLAACLEQEYRTSCALLSSPDLVEGIRAQVVEKDRNPQWHPRYLEDVSDDIVEKYFAPGEDELGLGSGSEGER